MALWDITTIEELEYDTTQGLSPAVCQIDSTHFIVARRNGYKLIMGTYSYDSDYETLTLIDTEEIDTVSGHPEYACIKPIGDYYIVSYPDADGDGHLRTYDLDGSYNWNTYIDDLEFDTDYYSHGDILVIDDNTFALASEGDSYNGFLRTFSIDNDGDTITEIDELDHGSSRGRYPSLTMVGVSGSYTLLGLGFVGYSYEVEFKIIRLLTSTYGSISVKDTWTWGTSNVYTAHCQLEYIGQYSTTDVYTGDKNGFILVHGATDYDGFIHTFITDYDGDNIEEIDEYEFDTSKAVGMSMGKLGERHYVCSYVSGDTPTGDYIVISVDEDWDNIDVEETYEYRASTVYTTALTLINNNTGIMAYSDSDFDGRVQTFNIDHSVEPYGIKSAADVPRPHIILGEIIDENSTGVTSAHYVCYTGKNLLVGQAFKNETGSKMKLLGGSFAMSKEGSPTGNFYAYIYALTDTFGTDATYTGSALATSDAIDGSLVPLVAGEHMAFTFSGVNQIEIADDAEYGVHVIGNAAWDSDDHIVIRTGFYGVNGNLYREYNGIKLESTSDLHFRLYGEEVVSDQDVEPNCFDNSNSFGTHLVKHQYTATLDTVYEEADFGTHVVEAAASAPVLPNSFDNVSTFGTHQLNLTVHANSLDNSPTFGTPQLDTFTEPVALVNTALFGTHHLAHIIYINQLANLNSMGSPQVDADITTDSLDNVNTFGTPQLDHVIYISLFDNSQTFGTPNLGGDIIANALDNSNSFGTPQVDHTIYVSSFNNSQTFGTPSLGVEKFILPTVLDNSNSFGTHDVSHTLYADSFNNSQTFGTPSLLNSINVDSIDNTQIFGVHTVDHIIYINALNNSNSFGTPSLSAEAVISPTALVNTNTFGSHTVTAGSVVEANALDNSNSFGTAQLDQVIYINQLYPTLDIEHPVVVVEKFIEPNSFVNTQTFGNPTVVVEYFIYPDKLDNVNNVGGSTDYDDVHTVDDNSGSNIYDDYCSGAKFDIVSTTNVHLTEIRVRLFKNIWEVLSGTPYFKCLVTDEDDEILAYSDNSISLDDISSTIGNDEHHVFEFDGTLELTSGGTYYYYVYQSTDLLAFFEGWVAQQTESFFPGTSYPHLADGRWTGGISVINQYDDDYNSPSYQVRFDESGGPEVSHVISVNKLDNTNTFGTPIVLQESDVFPNKLDNINEFGLAIVRPYVMHTTKLDNSSSFGIPLIILIIKANGLVNNQSFGTATSRTPHGSFFLFTKI